MKKSLQQKQEEFLIDALEYYTADTQRRCANILGNCQYSPFNANKEGISEGCLIGRKIYKDLQLRLDSMDKCSVEHDNIFDMLPKKLKDLEKEFLYRCQLFHDNYTYWGNDGLTSAGIIRLENIITFFNLDKQKFTKWLIENEH
jgi:hypothetical protein